MAFESTGLLELYIITYNRSKYLDKTLQQLIDCPFANFKITIVDNCSHDNTYDIFSAHKNKFLNLNYIRNKINIGADANVLRAAELSNGLYTWILCDDDFYDFTYCNDILIELSKGEVAAIMVGWATYYSWPKEGLRDTANNLMKNNFPFFCVPTFVPGSIFKTKLFQKQIAISYTNIVNLLPVMTYYVGLYDTTEEVYVSKNKIVVPGAQAPYDYTFLRVMVAILHTYYLIKSVDIRKQSFYQNYLTPNPRRLNINYTLWMHNVDSDVSLYSKYRYFKILDWKDKIVFIAVYVTAPIIKKINSSPSAKSFVKKVIYTLS